MKIDQISEPLIHYIHAPLGGVALIAGGVALAVTKGSIIHKKSGKIFYYSMLLSAMTALIISFLPNHKSPFLFSIGVFSSYFLVSGYRSLNYKQKDIDITTDKIIAYLIVLTGLVMVIYPIILYHRPSIILTIFGIVGIIFGIRDLLLFSDKTQLNKYWLRLHLGKMTGGYIAAVSAFFVVNKILPGIWNWFVPGIIGGIFITYWVRKVDKKKPLSHN